MIFHAVSLEIYSRRELALARASAIYRVEKVVLINLDEGVTRAVVCAGKKRSEKSLENVSFAYTYICAFGPSMGRYRDYFYLLNPIHNILSFWIV